MNKVFAQKNKEYQDQILGRNFRTLTQSEMAVLTILFGVLLGVAMAYGF